MSFRMTRRREAMAAAAWTSLVLAGVLPGCFREERWKDDEDAASDTASDVTGDAAWDVPPEGPSPDMPTDTVVDAIVADSTADPASEAMDEGDPGIAGGLGDPCNRPEDCMGVANEYRDCLLAMGEVTFPNGYCSTWCSGDTDCGSTGRCVHVLTLDHCYVPCSTSSGCRVGEGYTCRVIPYSDDTRTYCYPEG
jgi:hypothetical protein